MIYARLTMDELVLIKSFHSLMKVTTINYFRLWEDFSNWKSISTQNDIAIYSADPETSLNVTLNEQSHGLLHRNGLLKKWTSTKSIICFLHDFQRKPYPRKVFKISHNAGSIFMLHVIKKFCPTLFDKLNLLK